MRYLYYGFWLVILMVGLTFTALNSTVVKINYYVGEANVVLPVLMMIILLVGVLLGMLALLPGLLRSKNQCRQAESAIKKLGQKGS